MQVSKEEFERRVNERIEYRGDCSLSVSNTTQSAYLINLSESGALIALLGDHELETNTTVTLKIHLANDDVVVTQGRVAHRKDHFVGLECKPTTKQDKARLQAFLKAAGLPLTNAP
ncbi:PilZ domain-containing protein [Teredinibacter haidensis]|uniref:PilZ domain-containing protein n=1 Tax=Teredinibacter haidensis TaxID=2731755 RepID=UPI000948ADBD|nr:PilZ domain-containing protein [Teredinibacter haidensis]